MNKTTVLAFAISLFFASATLQAETFKNITGDGKVLSIEDVVVEKSVPLVKKTNVTLGQLYADLAKAKQYVLDWQAEVLKIEALILKVEIEAAKVVLKIP